VGEIGNLFNLIFTYPIFNGLMLLYNLFDDFGLSIIVLTLLIKLILFPLTLQQLKSMKATQALQPKMAEIRKKYSSDQQGQAAAMQALYKEYGINPLAGCLPLLIQLPVLYGLFYALNGVLRGTHSVADINSKLYPFIPHFTHFPNIYLNWFTFLGGANFHISLGVPDPTHILPILAGLATFVQLRMSQPKKAPNTGKNAPASDPTAQSMKTMQYFMPLITVFFGWTFPAGLALYWTISSIFQAVQQYFVTGLGGFSSLPALAAPSGGSGSNGASQPAAGSFLSRLLGMPAAAPQQDQAEREEPAEVVESDDGSVQVRTKTRSTARRRSSNASARRRSSNNSRRNVSRS
jgi:YidC/Oxa1 family membrane protein insertase